MPRNVILLIDDDPQVHSEVERALEDTDYRLFSAVDSETALQVLVVYGHRIVTAVVDLGLPPRVGQDCVDALRLAAPTLRLVGLAHAHPCPVEMGHLDACIEKPFTSAELLAELR